MVLLRLLAVLCVATAFGCDKRSLDPDAGSGTIGAGSGGAAAAGGGAGGSSSVSVDAQPDSFIVIEPPFPCGNGRLDPGEECDDGNRRPGDGCNVVCQVECYESCGGCGYFESCFTPACGNIWLDAGEACDDGNGQGGDGCSGACAIEPGWRCPAAGQRCAAICGDGRVVGLETCDDGNAIAGDGCSEICVREPSGASCGDGVVQGAEECDHGPYNADGIYGACTTRCRYGPRCVGLSRAGQRVPARLGARLRGLGPYPAGAGSPDRVAARRARA